MKKWNIFAKIQDYRISHYYNYLMYNNNIDDDDDDKNNFEQLSQSEINGNNGIESQSQSKRTINYDSWLYSLFKQDTHFAEFGLNHVGFRDYDRNDLIFDALKSSSKVAIMNCHEAESDNEIDFVIPVLQQQLKDEFNSFKIQCICNTNNNYQSMYANIAHCLLNNNYIMKNLK